LVEFPWLNIEFHCHNRLKLVLARSLSILA
jgi:hypothetical protein